MKRITVLVLVTFMFAAAIILLFSRSEKRNPIFPSESAQNTDPQPLRQTDKGKIPKREIDFEGLGDLMNGDYTENSKRFSDEITLTRDDWEAFMAKHGRDTETLVAAARKLCDLELFAELAENHADEPLVIAAILELFCHRPEQAEVLGGEKEWVKRLKESDPENGIAALYGARIAFENGDPIAAYIELQEIESALFADFYMKALNEKVQEVYTDAGWENDDAFILSQIGMAVPFANEMTKMSQDLATAMDEALETGNQALAEDLWEGGIAAARLIREVEEAEVIGAVVGGTMEAILFDRLDAFDLAPGEETLVIEWMAESEARIEIIRGFGGGTNFSENDWRQYWRIFEVEGEIAAMRWAGEQ